MAKHQILSPQKTQPDVAGALEEVRLKKSREQIRNERFKPFVPVIEEALRQQWKWSPILQLIRKRGGPSLTKMEAEALYEANKPTSMSSQFSARPSGNTGNIGTSDVKQEVRQ